jgi:hypothetical protein
MLLAQKLRQRSNEVNEVAYEVVNKLFNKLVEYLYLLAASGANTCLLACEPSADDEKLVAFLLDDNDELIIEEILTFPQDEDHEYIFEQLIVMLQQQGFIVQDREDFDLPCFSVVW